MQGEKARARESLARRRIHCTAGAWTAPMNTLSGLDLRESGNGSQSGRRRFEPQARRERVRAHDLGARSRRGAQAPPRHRARKQETRPKVKVSEGAGGHLCRHVRGRNAIPLPMPTCRMQRASACSAKNGFYLAALGWRQNLTGQLLCFFAGAGYIDHILISNLHCSFHSTQLSLKVLDRRGQTLGQ